MPASNHTTHYNLPRYAPTDNTDWLSTFNGNQDSLDNLIYQLNQAKDTMQDDLDTAIAEIKTLQGAVTTLQRHDTVIDSSITSLQSTVSSLTNSITSIDTAITTINTKFAKTTEATPISIGSFISYCQGMSLIPVKTGSTVELHLNFALNSGLTPGVEYQIWNAGTNSGILYKPYQEFTRLITCNGGAQQIQLRWATTGVLYAKPIVGSGNVWYTEVISAIVG